ncbi:MAG: 2-oxoacid:acceptor oxidoreductase family protein [Christensenellales bacterium]|jgi:2-oxoglutarate ferredoxin oxidoreductase subunit gamma
MTEQIIIAGFGGQGVMSMGQMLAYAGMHEDRHVSWLPSYGPEMRGGTANCHVVLSDEPVASPIVAQADAVIALNRPSLDKYESCVRPGGRLFINSSLIDRGAKRDDIEVYKIPANEIAAEIGNARVAGMTMLGAYLAASGAVPIESVLESLLKVLGEKKAKLVPANRLALERGAALAGQSNR